MKLEPISIKIPRSRGIPTPFPSRGLLYFLHAVVAQPLAPTPTAFRTPESTRFPHGSRALRSFHKDLRAKASATRSPLAAKPSSRFAHTGFHDEEGLKRLFSSFVPCCTKSLNRRFLSPVGGIAVYSQRAPVGLPDVGGTLYQAEPQL
jgi:hypothetical protein